MKFFKDTLLHFIPTVIFTDISDKIITIDT